MFNARNLILTLCTLSVIACGASGDGKVKGGGRSLKATGEGPCEDASECEGGVCVGLIDGDHPPVYCSEECTDSCSDGFTCDSDTFALVDLSFCRFGDSEEEVRPPEEPPTLPCTSDAECGSGSVCATVDGERSCTMPCSVDDDCHVNVGGATLAFWECGQDEAKDRQVCVPDPDCFTGSVADFQACYEFDYGF